MKTVPAWVGSLILVVIAVLVANPDVNAAGKGSRGGGGHSGPARAVPSRSNSRAAASRQAQGQRSTRSFTASGTVGPGQVLTPYRYGTGRMRGYANRPRYWTNRGYSYGNRYAMANQNIRLIVNRLRQTHAMLARIDHDYQGHRVQAMRAISRAVQQLTHQRATTYGISAMGMNGPGVNALSLRNRAGAGVRVGAARVQPMTQGQSDAHMRRALRNLQGVHTQLTAQGSTANHWRARGSVQRAMRELNVALNVR
jgi:hypothetical protein